MLKFIVACFVLTASSVFANSTVQIDGFKENRIIGGRDADPRQFPHQANLRFADNTPICSAVIIHKFWVLSAAQCTQRQTSIPANVRVVVGTIRRTRGGYVYQVAAIKNHPGYDGILLTYDISLIQTKTEIVFDMKYVRPVPLPKADVREQTQVAAIVSGWGNSIYPVRPGHPQAYPDVLQYKRTLVLDRNECIRQFGSRGRLVYPYSLCTTNPIQRGICQGDAGSPLVSSSYELIGIAVWFVPCGQGLPDVYIRVHPLLTWIISIIKTTE